MSQRCSVSSMSVGLIKQFEFLIRQDENDKKENHKDFISSDAQDKLMLEGKIDYLERAHSSYAGLASTAKNSKPAHLAT